MVGQQPVGDPVSGADKANAIKDALGNRSRLELIESVLRPWGGSVLVARVSGLQTINCSTFGFLETLTQMRPPLPANRNSLKRFASGVARKDKEGSLFHWFDIRSNPNHCHALVAESRKKIMGLNLPSGMTVQPRLQKCRAAEDVLK